MSNKIYDRQHPQFLRNAIEEHFAELVLENGAYPDLEDKGLNDAILSRCDDVCKRYGKKKVVDEIDDFIICIGFFQAYACHCIIMRYVKNEYIKLLHQGHDPDDPTFAQRLADTITIDKSLHKYLIINTSGYVERDPMKVVHTFMSNVHAGIIAVPITKPYLDYVLTERAKEILSKYNNSKD